MELPDDILSLVRDFARPVTRPDWRTLHRMPSLLFHISVAQSLNRSSAQSLYELTTRDSDYTYHLAFYNGLPYVDFIYARDRVPLYIPFL